MKVLLDTHMLIWWLTDAPELGPVAREIIASPANVVFLSAACVWELRIKAGLGKVTLPDDFAAVLQAQPFEKLPISVAHAHEVGALPLHHRDPFDRVLIAQARCDGLTLLTRDAVVAKYEVAHRLA